MILPVHDGVCGAVCGDACVPGCGLARFGCGLARESMDGLVLRGFGLCGSCVCPVRVSRLPPVSFYRYRTCTGTGFFRVSVCVPAPPGVFLPVPVLFTVDERVGVKSSTGDRALCRILATYGIHVRCSPATP